MSPTEQSGQDWTAVSYEKRYMIENREDKARESQLEQMYSERMPQQSESSSHSTTPSEEGPASILSLPGAEFEAIETRATSPMELPSSSYNCPDFGEQEDWPAAGEWTVVYSKRSRKAWALQERMEQQYWMKTQLDFGDEDAQGPGPSTAEFATVEELTKCKKGKRGKKTKKHKADAKKVQNQDMCNIDTKKVESQEAQKIECQPAKETVTKATKARPQKQKKNNKMKTGNSKRKEAEPEDVLHRFNKRQNLSRLAFFILTLGLSALLYGIATRKDSARLVVEQDPNNKAHPDIQLEARWIFSVPKMKKTLLQVLSPRHVGEL